jgi:hypothetical protein
MHHSTEIFSLLKLLYLHLCPEKRGLKLIKGMHLVTCIYALNASFNRDLFIIEIIIPASMA